MSTTSRSLLAVRARLLVRPLLSALPSGAAPGKAGGGGSLPDPPPATKVAIRGLSMTEVFYLDATGPAWRLYRGHGGPATPCAAVAGVDQCLHSIDFLSKQ